VTKRRKTIAVIGVVVAIIAAATLYVTQVRQPLRHSFDFAKIYSCATAEAKGLIAGDYGNARQGIVSDIQLLSDVEFDFANPLDFAQVLVFFKVTNMSVFPISNAEVFVLDLGGVQGRFLYKQDAAVPVNIDPVETTTVRLDLAMYVKDLTDAQIADLVKKLSVELQFDRPLIGGGHVPIAVPFDLEFAEHLYA